jgi:dolichol kinase
MTGLLLAPLISSALLTIAQKARSAPVLLPGWLIEDPATLPDSPLALPAIDSLILSRYNLVNLATYCSFILMLHVCSSRWFENRYGKSSTAPEGERTSVPRNEVRRTIFYALFMFVVTTFNICLRAVLQRCGLRIWQRK